MSRPIDADARIAALDISQSFAVSAPAGSGKTGLLTQRVLALLAKCEQPENILAITFTKKAAAEMQNRILSALIKVQNKLERNEAPPEDEYELTTWNLAQQVLERDRIQQWQLLSLPNRLRITTIDGFCRQLSQQMPLSNGMGSTPSMLENKEAEHAYLLAARETLALLEKKSDIQNDLMCIAQHFNNQITTIETLFVNLLGRRDQWLGSLFASKDQRELMESSLSAVISDQLTKLHDHLLPYSGELVELADYAANNLSNENSESIICTCLGITQLPQQNHQGIQQWCALTDLLLTQDGSPRKTINKKSGFPAPDKKTSKEQQLSVKSKKERLIALTQELALDHEAIRLLANTRVLPQHQYDDKQWELLDSLTRVLTQLVANLYIIFQQQGKADFIQITQAALTSLGNEDEPTDIALTLDYKIYHILVDEFQDTSTPQLQLLKRLTAGWQYNDGKTVFLVGDAMQSCYSFREANVGIFLDVRENGMGSIAINPIDLSVNFRSQENLVNWFNTVFSELFPTKNSINEGAVKYLKSHAYNASSDTDAVNSYLFCSEEKPKVRNHEADKIIEIVKQNQKVKPLDTIAILVRKRSQVGQITRALNSENISYQATELDKLNQNMIVQDLLTLTRALLYPNDRIAWLALLRAPWCGLDMVDLYEVAHTKCNQKNLTIPSLLFDHYQDIKLSPSGKNLLTRFCKNLKLIFLQQGKFSLRVWIEGAWLQLGGNSLLLDEEEQNATKTFFSSLEKYQQAGKISNWSIFTKIIDELYNINNQPRENSSQVINTHNSTEPKPIEIMTIHKSKGLEFDTVILPGLDLGLQSDNTELLAWIEWLDNQQQSRLLISPVHGTGNEKDSIYDYIRSQHKYRQQLEADRLFYVACTRAIKKLYLLAYTKSKQGELMQMSQSSILGRIWDNIIGNSEIITLDNENNSSEISQAIQHPNQIIRLTETWQRPNKIENTLLKKYRLDNAFLSAQSDNIPSANGLLFREKRYFGQVLHGALQLISETNHTLWDEKKINDYQLYWHNEFIHLALSVNKSADYSKKIVNTLNLILKNSTAPWILDNSHKDSQCELSVFSSSNNQVKEHIIDRTFIDKETNIRWIIDYKSSEPDEGQNVDSFINQEINQYRDQLASYEFHFKQDPEPIALALYFPILDIFKKIK